MKVETVITTLTCDVCGREVKEFCEGAGEMQPVAYKIIKWVYYGKEQKLDICKPCHDAICKFMFDLAPKPLRPCRKDAK